MSKYIAIVFLIFCIVVPGFTDQVTLPAPELAHIFQVGNLPEQLGEITSRFENTDAPPISGPQGLRFLDNGNLVLMDNINRRLIQYSKNYLVLSITPIDLWLFQLSMDKGKVIGWYSGDVSSGRVFIANLEKIPPQIIELTPINLESSSYSFFGFCEKLAVFQYENGSFFGLDFSQDVRNTKLVSDSTVRELLKTKNNKEDIYEFDGNMVLRDGQLLSHVSKYAYHYFAKQLFSYQPFDALANGNYFFSSSGHFGIVGKQGQILKEFNLPDKYKGKIGGMASSPDGFVYFLYFEKTESIKLYRVGPFTELTMSFLGKRVTINDDKVRLRENPSTTSSIIRVFSKGEVVAILSKQQDEEVIGGVRSSWYKVRCWDSLDGWVFGAFINFSENN